MSEQTSRRQFLKTSTVLAAGATLAGGLSITQSAHAQGSDEMKVALIGAGGRAGGAIRDRAQVGDNYKVVAVADVFAERARVAANGLRNDGQNSESHLYGKVDLPNDRVFGGMLSYKEAIESLDPGDMVVIARQPGLHPYAYRAAVERGCHVFIEKPICVDAPGFRHTMESNRIAEEKGLKVVVGFQRRYEQHYNTWMERIHAGAIGDIQYTRVFWNGGGIWQRPRNRNESELAFQLRNWYHFTWLCGDNICEQHCHNIDIGNWIHSKGDRMAHPVRANAMGGRLHRAGPEHLMRQAPPFADREAWEEWFQPIRGSFNRNGQAWDSYFVEFEYADGSRMYSQCRHVANVWDHQTEYAFGTRGWGRPGRLGTGQREGQQETWRNEGRFPKGSMQWEHDVLVDAIRNDKPLHDGWHASMACMAAVLGREAAYCGRIVNWNELVERGRPYHPNGEITSMDDASPVQPDANGFYESTVAVPGQYNPFVS